MTVLAVDIGKTTCRVRVGDTDLVGPGAVGLADPEGGESALRAVLDLIGAEESRRLLGADGCVAGAGHLAGGALAESIARRFVEELGLRSCAVTSDAIAAHVGAFGGRPGAVLAAGTGSIAVGVSAAGQIHVSDGVGQWLGDEGSGAWIGLEGLRAAVRARDGRGPETLLRLAAETAYGDLGLLPLTLEATGNVPQAAAGFAATVCGLADRDELAGSIIRRAAQALADTAVAVARASGHREVALVGGLQNLGARLFEPWRLHLDEAGIAVAASLGSALDGSATLASHRGLPHEATVTRYP